MLETIVAGVGSGAWGPIVGSFVGLFGGMYNKYMAYKVQKLQNEDNIGARAHEKDMSIIAYNQKKDITRMEIDGRARQAAIDGEIDLEKIAWTAQGKAIDSDRATYLAPEAQEKSAFATYAMTVVDFVRGMIRPLLTVLLVWAALYVTYRFLGLVETLNDGGLPVNLVVQLTIISVVTVLTLATTAVGYWFGSRPTVLKSLANTLDSQRSKS